MTDAEHAAAAKQQKGVTYRKDLGRYTARISGFGSKRQALGLFDTAEEAGAAYKEAKAQAASAKRAERMGTPRTGADAPLSPEQIIEIYEGEYYDLVTRRIGERSPNAGCFYSDELGKYVAKLRTAPDTFELIGTFDTLGEADAAHHEAYYSHRYAQKLRNDPPTLEDAVVRGAQLYTEGGFAEESANAFRHKLERWYPDMLDYSVSISHLLKDEMIQARGGFRLVIDGKSEPKLVFTDAARTLPASA